MKILKGKYFSGVSWLEEKATYSSKRKKDVADIYKATALGLHYAIESVRYLEENDDETLK